MAHTVHISSVHHPFDPRIFHKELQSLCESGYEATFITHHTESTRRNGINIDAVDKVDSRLERWLNLPTIAKRAKEIQADVYHFHDPELLPVGWYLSNFTDGKVVYDVHENYTDAIQVRDWIPNVIKPLLMNLFPTIEANMANTIDLIITADDSTSERMRELVGVPVTTIRNYPKVTEISTRDIDFERSSEYVLAYVGGLCRERGLFRMLELTAKLRDEGLDVCLWLIGDFQDEKIEKEAIELIEAKGISDNVELFGYIDHHEMFSYLALADIGLLLADEDRFKWNVPTKFFEYLYCKIPVVSTDINSLRNYTSDRFCITVSGGDIGTVSDELTEILEDEDKRMEMGKAGYQKVMCEYNWENEKQALLDEYKVLCES